MKTTTLTVINDHAIREIMVAHGRRTESSNPTTPVAKKSLRRRLQQEMCPRCQTLGIELFHQWRGCRD